MSLAGSDVLQPALNSHKKQPVVNSRQLPVILFQADRHVALETGWQLGGAVTSKIRGGEKNKTKRIDRQTERAS